MSKQAGRMSQGANDFLAPYAPTIGTATDVGTNRPYNNGAATVTFTATGPNAADSFTAYAVEDPTKTATGSSSPLTVTGLASGTNYTFKVYGTNAAGGQGSHSEASNQITSTTVPQAPSLGAVSNTCSGRAYNDGLVTVAITAGATGGKAISGYYAISNGGQNASSATSPVSVTGLLSATNYTFQGRVSNANGNSELSASSSAVTVTTAPAQVSSVSASTPSAGVDRITWSAPANGGSGITNYYWASSDGKTGNTTSTTVDINQEQGTAQTYTVRADNACGSAPVSPASNSVTTTFSFVPFGVFSFSPFGVFSFSPFGVFSFSPFGFSPFGVFSFSPFGVFGFSPFGFSPFGFSPFGFSPFGFSPFGFSPFSPGGFGFTPIFMRSLAPMTKVRMADGSMKAAEDVYVGDVLMSVELPEFTNSYTTEELMAWTSTQNITELPLTTTTVNKVSVHPASSVISVNEDVFSPNHILLVKRGDEISMKRASELLTTDMLWNYSASGWIEINILEIHDYEHTVITINCEPNDLFFTEGALTHDGNEWLQPQQ
jgi:hypothetical protein